MDSELIQSFKNFFERQRNEMHTAMPGKITAFDSATGMATVQPVMKYRKPDNTTIDFPEVSGVPVCFPQGAGQAVSIAYPVAEGDTCMMVFSEQSLDLWQYGQETTTDLRFDLSNAMCIPGLFSTANPAMKQACEEGAIVLSAGGTSVVIGASGVQIKGNVSVEGGMETSGDTVAAGKSVSGHTHTGDSGGQTSAPN